MKNVLKFLLLILCFASYTLHAQGDLKLGPEAGINYSLFNLKEDNQNATNEQSIFGLKLGLVAEYRFVDMFGLQTGIFFDQSGSKGSILNGIKDVNNNIVNAEFRYDFNRLTLPLTAQVYFGHLYLFYLMVVEVMMQVILSCQIIMSPEKKLILPVKVSIV